MSALALALALVLVVSLKYPHHSSARQGWLAEAGAMRLRADLVATAPPLLTPVLFWRKGKVENGRLDSKSLILST